MNRLTFIFLISIFNFIDAQNIENGTYVGFEQNPFCYSDTCNIDYAKIHLQKNQVYYKLTLNISQNKSTLSKIPVKYINRRKLVIDSTRGGYYLYVVDLYNNKIYGKLKNAKYNRIASGIPRYVNANYTFIKIKNGILISNGKNKNILLRKLN